MSSKKLPINAHQFFTPDKPKSYLYYADNVPKGLITGRQVETVGSRQDDVNTMENKPAHLISPHLQPTVALPKVPTQTSLQVPPRHRVVTVTSVPPRVPTQITPVRHTATQVQGPKCKYMVKTTNPNCGCSAVYCGNDECPLSKKTQKGVKAPIHSINCSQKSCRWFTET